MEAGESVSVLARQLGVSRKSVYQWRNRYRLGGSNALRGRGRMTNADLSAHKEIAEKQRDKEARQTSLEELARAQRRISALERKIGQQGGTRKLLDQRVTVQPSVDPELLGVAYTSFLKQPIMGYW